MAIVDIDAFSYQNSTKTDRVYLAYLGEDAIVSRNFMTFDRQVATESLSYFDIDDIPKVPMNLPPGVSDVKFRSNLDFCQNSKIHSCNEWLSNNTIGGQLCNLPL